ncbi:Interferon-induced transmembrane protein 3 [Tupaia chinensis]|uniref:Interferon-induced transmembrane protein 3 n=1 Tax=Tupaia chinensis TaxID=246437 RepID=L8YCD3_TUPCH|nr:Interferon-induced transmembrane protein 3 [Tupaia chinensis]
MNHTSQTFFTRASAGLPPNYEMLREEHEVRVPGAPPPAAPVTSTVINIRSETSGPDHGSRDRKMVGDVIGAQAYASTAKCLNVCTLVLGILMVVVAITVVIISASVSG